MQVIPRTARSDGWHLLFRRKVIAHLHGPSTARIRSCAAVESCRILTREELCHRSEWGKSAQERGTAVFYHEQRRGSEDWLPDEGS